MQGCLRPWAFGHGRRKRTAEFVLPCLKPLRFHTRQSWQILHIHLPKAGRIVCRVPCDTLPCLASPACASRQRKESGRQPCRPLSYSLLWDTLSQGWVIEDGSATLAFLICYKTAYKGVALSPADAGAGRAQRSQSNDEGFTPHIPRQKRGKWRGAYRKFFKYFLMFSSPFATDSRTVLLSTPSALATAR